MLQLMKYEFIKEKTSKYIMGGFLLAGELAFLIGTLLREANLFGIGMLTLIVTSIVGFFVVALEAITTYYGDMKEKRGYMLFMTPNSVFSILGSKLLVGIITVVVWTLLVGILAFIDMTLLAATTYELSNFFEEISEIMRNFSIDISWGGTVLNVGELVFGWVSMVTSAFLAITLSMTVLNGMKAKGFISFILYIILNLISEKVLNILNEIFTQNSVQLTAMTKGLIDTGISFGVNVVFSVICFLCAGELLRKRLSL